MEASSGIDKNIFPKLMCQFVTHVDRDSVAVEDGGLGAVGGEVPVELVPVPVPLDRVQLVALKK